MNPHVASIASNHGIARAPMPHAVAHRTKLSLLVQLLTQRAPPFGAVREDFIRAHATRRTLGYHAHLRHATRQPKRTHRRRRRRTRQLRVVLIPETKRPRAQPRAAILVIQLLRLLTRRAKCRRSHTLRHMLRLHHALILLIRHYTRLGGPTKVPLAPARRARPKKHHAHRIGDNLLTHRWRRISRLEHDTGPIRLALPRARASEH
mmetsp:Transcript_8858/g.20127  ORF Transcript_8858/g.20127 Transcript_8858/m.20127 type:complete len:206 (+) Transcript_8858:5092-5709(+)